MEHLWVIAEFPIDFGLFSDHWGTNLRPLDPKQVSSTKNSAKNIPPRSIQLLLRLN